MSLQNEGMRPSAWVARACAAAIALAALGCDDRGDVEDAVQALETEPPCDLIDASLDGTVAPDAGAPIDDAGSVEVDAGRRNPGEAYIADVTANGTGCPPGTWAAELSPSGQSVRATFSAFEAEVGPTRAVSIKNCQLAIKLHSPQGLSYSVQKVYYGGYAYLEDGVNARLIASYYFQGNPSDSRQSETTFIGPKDDTYLIEDTRNQLESTPPWSPCGVDRNLNVNLTMRLFNTSNPRRNGYVNVSPVDGAGTLDVTFVWRRCSQ